MKDNWYGTVSSRWSSESPQCSNVPKHSTDNYLTLLSSKSLKKFIGWKNLVTIEEFDERNMEILDRW